MCLSTLREVGLENFTAHAHFTRDQRVTPPDTTSANGCAELGTLNARTVIVYVPATGALSVTCSTLLRRSAAPPATDWLLANTLPRNVPLGPASMRCSRSARARWL